MFLLRDGLLTLIYKAFFDGLKTVENLSSNKNLSSVHERIIITYMYKYRMRNIHAYIISEYGMESVKSFGNGKIKTENKMMDFQNHRRFLLRCLSKDIIPVNVRLKSNIKTPKGNYIISKAGKSSIYVDFSFCCSNCRSLIFSRTELLIH